MATTTRRNINIRQAAALSRRDPVYYLGPSPIRKLAPPAASRLPRIYFIVVGKGEARRLAPASVAAFHLIKTSCKLCGRVGPRVPCRLGPPRLTITSWVKRPAKQGLASRTLILLRAPITRLAEGEVVVMRLFLISWIFFPRAMAG
jgi:hypothetical protein